MEGIVMYVDCKCYPIVKIETRLDSIATGTFCFSKSAVLDVTDVDTIIFEINHEDNIDDLISAFTKNREG